jgi:hypothetical protein
VAFSANRVPQVGQIFVFGVDVVSGLIRDKIIPRSKGVTLNALSKCARKGCQGSEPWVG